MSPALAHSYRWGIPSIRGERSGPISTIWCEWVGAGLGGIRINRRPLQEKVLQILGIDGAGRPMFGLLESLSTAPRRTGNRAGAGPDCGFNQRLRFDPRRDRISKTTQAQSLMDGAPTTLDPEQLAELGSWWSGRHRPIS